MIGYFYNCHVTILKKHTIDYEPCHIRYEVLIYYLKSFYWIFWKKYTSTCKNESIKYITVVSLHPILPMLSS